MHACIHTCIHSYIHTYIRTYIHTYIHTHTHTHIHTHTSTHTHTYIHTYIHKHTHIHTYTHTHTHIHTPGTCKTQLYGYGGFEVSLTPGYSGELGAAWLEAGNCHVVANIRGGGEYGPNWHKMALKENRQKAYEDFFAVAEQLIERGVTSPSRLACRGGSNGGLLVGNALVQRPDLFGAVVCQVPLLDMRRYSKLLAGASWMAEFGDPDTSDWEYIQKFSPYHLLDPATKYPKTLFTTSTRDDRVHPAHARKMVYKMLDGQETRSGLFYYENIEGGHGGAADADQSARVMSLIYDFMSSALE